MACDPNGLIGDAGKLPWHYPEDLKDFYAKTDQQIIIMGRKTFGGLPKEKIGDRCCIVFSRKKAASENNIIFVSSLETFLKLEPFPENKMAYMVGGDKIAKLFLEAGLVSEFLLTHIEKKYSGDTFFPWAFIKDWPRTLIKKTDDFSAFRYHRNTPSDLFR